MTLPVFPTHVFNPQGQRYQLVGRTISGGDSVSGRRHLIGISGGPIWYFFFSRAHLRTRGQRLAWRAFEAIADQGIARIIVPKCDWRHAPLTGYGVNGVLHSDQSPFSDSSGYQQTPVVNAETVGSAALRATTLTITTDGGEILGGEDFTIVHPNELERMYRIRTVEERINSTTYEVTIRPPLRGAVASGTEVDFVNPRCVMQVMNPDDMAPEVELLKFAQGSVVFCEAD